MRYIHWLLLTVILAFHNPVQSGTCDVKFTENHVKILKAAFRSMDDEEQAYLISAVVWQESASGLELVSSGGKPWKISNQEGYWDLMESIHARYNCDNALSCEKIKQSIAYRSKHPNRSEFGNLVAQLNGEGASSAKPVNNKWQFAVGEEYRKEIAKKISYLKQCVRL